MRAVCKAQGRGRDKRRRSVTIRGQDQAPSLRCNGSMTHLWAYCSEKWRISSRFFSTVAGSAVSARKRRGGRRCGVQIRELLRLMVQRRVFNDAYRTYQAALQPIARHAAHSRHLEETHPLWRAQPGRAWTQRCCGKLVKPCSTPGCWQCDQCGGRCTPSSAFCVGPGGGGGGECGAARGMKRCANAIECTNPATPIEPYNSNNCNKAQTLQLLLRLCATLLCSKRPERHLRRRI